MNQQQIFNLRQEYHKMQDEDFFYYVDENDEYEAILEVKDIFNETKEWDYD